MVAKAGINQKESPETGNVRRKENRQQMEELQRGKSEEVLTEVTLQTSLNANLT